MRPARFSIRSELLRVELRSVFTASVGDASGFARGGQPIILRRFSTHYLQMPNARSTQCRSLRASDGGGHKLLMTKPWRCKVICKRATRTLWIRAASARAIRWRIFCLCASAGHCEYFATAMTIMLRTLGIPARYINGFKLGEYNDVGGDFIVRASDAHSWVEAYFPGRGWITFDPTPAGEAGVEGMVRRASRNIWIGFSISGASGLSTTIFCIRFRWDRVLDELHANGRRRAGTWQRTLRCACESDETVWQTDAAASRWAPDIIAAWQSQRLHWIVRRQTADEIFS